MTSDSNARDRVTVRKYDSSLGHLWSVDLSSPGSSFDVWDLVSDAPGNIYVMGRYSGQLQLDDEVTLSTRDPAETETFLVKLSSLGEHEWGKSFGGAGHRQDWTMSASDAGELAIFGTFSGSLDLGGGALTTTTVNDEDLDIVLAKLDADGSHLWSRQLGDSGRQESSGSMVIDSEGAVLIAGSLNGTAVDFGMGATGADEGWSVFLARFPRP
ncbi:choice-of-anchor E domain-containing protein [Sorangium sp. So ce260]|uniref:choice-of-anchor E domain-containing protein n=1 Tax=Sorangium sp. So ce260 TaxID=3133291 RepID=UPI003F60C57F